MKIFPNIQFPFYGLEIKIKLMLTIDQYDEIKKYVKPIFLITVVIFFLTEISYLLNIVVFFQEIPDLVFFIIVFIYFIIDFLPIFKPEWIEGYEPPVVEEPEEIEEELDPEEQELKELEDIAL